jgi:hypothetical protein
MSTKPPKTAAAKKTTKAKKVTLRGLIARTQKIADEVTMLLGQLRALDTGEKTVTISLSSGGSTKQSASPPPGP